MVQCHIVEYTIDPYKSISKKNSLKFERPSSPFAGSPCCAFGSAVAADAVLDEDVPKCRETSAVSNLHSTIYSTC